MKIYDPSLYFFIFLRGITFHRLNKSFLPCRKHIHSKKCDQAVPLFIIYYRNKHPFVPEHHFRPRQTLPPQVTIMFSGTAHPCHFFNRCPVGKIMIPFFRPQPGMSKGIFLFGFISSVHFLCLLYGIILYFLFLPFNIYLSKGLFMSTHRKNSKFFCKKITVIPCFLSNRYISILSSTSISNLYAKKNPERKEYIFFLTGQTGNIRTIKSPTYIPGLFPTASVMLYDIRTWGIRRFSVRSRTGDSGQWSLPAYTHSLRHLHRW